MVTQCSLANAIKISAAIFNLVSFSLFDRRDSDKSDKISRFFLAVANERRLRDHKTSAQTLGDKNWDEFTV